MKSQRCPTCQITEALGSYCTKCLAKTQPSWVITERRGADPEVIEALVRAHSKTAGVLPRLTKES